MTYKSELAPLHVSLAIGRNSRSNSGRLGYPLHVPAFSSFYPRDVVSGVFATATWLGGWLSVTVGIVSKRLNLS